MRQRYAVVSMHGTRRDTVGPFLWLSFLMQACSLTNMPCPFVPRSHQVHAAALRHAFSLSGRSAQRCALDCISGQCVLLAHLRLLAAVAASGCKQSDSQCERVHEVRDCIQQHCAAWAQSFLSSVSRGRCPSGTAARLQWRVSGPVCWTCLERRFCLCRVRPVPAAL